MKTCSDLKAFNLIKAKSTIKALKTVEKNEQD